MLTIEYLLTNECQSLSASNFIQLYNNLILRDFLQPSIHAMAAVIAFSPEKDPSGLKTLQS